MKPSSPVIDAQGVGKTFHVEGGIHTALRGLTFAVEKNEFCAIVGPSGCGKTTLLRIVAGLEANDEGCLKVDSATTISMVFQESNLLPWMNLRDNLVFLLTSRGIQKEQALISAREWLIKLGLEKFSQAFPHQVSGGMRQRIALARSFALQASLLLMDEPFVHLDDFTRTKLHDELELHWQDAKNTVFFVTHDIEEAVLLADRVMVFSAAPGTIVNEFYIDLPRPRIRSELRENKMFIDLVKTITKIINQNCVAV